MSEGEDLKKKADEVEKAKIRIQVTKDMKEEMECALEFHRKRGDPGFAGDSVGDVMKERAIEMIWAARKYEAYEKFRREYFESRGHKPKDMDGEVEGDQSGHQ
jgi:hypothetical protein